MGGLSVTTGLPPLAPATTPNKSLILGGLGEGEIALVAFFITYSIAYTKGIFPLYSSLPILIYSHCFTFSRSLGSGLFRGKKIKRV